MRRRLIQTVLPLVFCMIPVLAGLLIAAALPAAAWTFYREHLTKSDSGFIDLVIVGLGLLLFVAQLFVAWRALRWRGTKFDDRADTWLSNLAQAAEWFPLLGLLGTVAGILQTFSAVGSGAIGTDEIISKYAVAITATGSGLMMALINIFPTWIVLIGRDLILTLGGGDSSTPGPYARKP